MSERIFGPLIRRVFPTLRSAGMPATFGTTTEAGTVTSVSLLVESAMVTLPAAFTAIPSLPTIASIESMMVVVTIVMPPAAFPAIPSLRAITSMESAMVPGSLAFASTEFITITSLFAAGTAESAVALSVFATAPIAVKVSFTGTEAAFFAIPLIIVAPTRRFRLGLVGRGSRRRRTGCCGWRRR